MTVADASTRLARERSSDHHELGGDLATPGDRRSRRLVQRIADSLAAECDVAVLVTGYDVTQPVVAIELDHDLVIVTTDEGNVLYLSPEILVGAVVGPPLERSPDADARSVVYG